MYVPSIWDYLGQGIQGGVQGNQQRLARNDANDQFLMQLLAQQAQTGQINAMDANSTDPFLKRGIKLQASPAEMARRIASSPTGAPEISNIMPGMIPTPMMQFKPWGDDQRRVAGLPTQAQINVEDRAGKTAVTGMKLDSMQQFSPMFQQAAGRYVPQAINSLGREITMKDAGQIAEAAFQNWLIDQQEAGEFGVEDEETQQFARSFFDEAVQTAIRSQEELRLLGGRANYYMGGGSRMTPAQVMAQYRMGIDNANREVDRLMAKWEMYSKIPEGPLKAKLLEANPQYKADMETIERQRRLSSVYQQGIGELSAGVEFVSPETARAIQMLEGQGAEAAPPTSGGGGSALAPNDRTGGGIGRKMTPEQFNRWSVSLRQVAMSNRPRAQQMFDELAVFLTPAEARRLAQQVGVTYTGGR